MMKTILFGILAIGLVNSIAHATNCSKGNGTCSSSKGAAQSELYAMTRIVPVFSEHLYDIQPETSKMEFRVDSPIGEIWASFEDFKGDFAMLDTGVHSDPAEVDVNTDSLDTNAAFIGMLLRSESFFDVDNFPRIRFVGSSFEWFNEKQAVLKGYMTIQNMTQPVAFYVEMVNPDVENKYSKRITMKATTTIRRSEFGIRTLLPIVSDDVNLYMSVDAVKRDASTIYGSL
jgi:polyisoprenoid-binding protein YceI